MNKKIKSHKADFLIVGAGFAGVTFARCAADAGKTVHIIDKRDHIGGNCYSYKDAETGIEIHKYGPHIFHTNSEEIWNFINRFTDFSPYIHRVKANYHGEIFSMPINLHTINQFYRKSFSPNEAEKFIEGLRINISKVENFEDYVLSSLGKDLYRAFFRDYTIKQWGIDPKQIPISTARRLPIRFNYDDNYFNDKYQGIPNEGYTTIFKRMLDNPNIKILLNSDFIEYRNSWKNNYKKLVFTGSIDEYYNYEYGHLPYRTVYFEEIRDKEIIGTSVLNFTDMKYKFTRIHEHKWFTPAKKFTNSIAFKEFSDITDSRKNPYYPIRNYLTEKIFTKYCERGKDENGVIHIGRLAEYRYYDMHQVIGSALSKFKETIKK